ADVREALAPLASAADSNGPAPRAGARLQAGRVVDVAGRPVAGAEVTLEAGELLFFRTARLQTSLRPSTVLARTTSRPDGSFELETPLATGAWLFARGAGLAPLVAEATPAHRGTRCLLPVVAPAAELRGVVLDGARRPLEGATIVLRPPAELLAALEHEER